MLPRDDERQRELALDEASRMRVLASEMRQMGFIETARFLQKNADAAMKWAGRKGKQEWTKQLHSTQL